MPLSLVSSSSSASLQSVLIAPSLVVVAAANLAMARGLPAAAAASSPDNVFALPHFLTSVEADRSSVGGLSMLVSGVALAFGRKAHGSSCSLLRPQLSVCLVNPRKWTPISAFCPRPS